MVCASAPEPVKGLRAEHIYRYQGLYDVWVRWDKNELEPDNYTVLIDLYRNDTKLYQKSVPGVSRYTRDQIRLP